MLNQTEVTETREPLDLCGSRRQLFRGLAAVGVTTIGAGVLTACGGGDDAATDDGTAAPSEGGETTGGSGGSAAAGVPTSEVPVGEARVVDLAGQRVVVAQPTEGEFVAFSARCTHQGTIVDSSGGLDLRCPAHGSEFDGATGDVRNGPATSPLPAIEITVEGDQIVPA